MQLRWQSMKPTQANIPINTRAVHNLTDHWFGSAVMAFPATVTIASHKEMDVANHLGGLVRVSAQEVVHAFIFGVRNAVARGADDTELAQWKRAMLTTTFSFEEIVTVDALYWRSANLREKVVSEFRAVAITPVQRVCQILEFKTSREKSLGNKLSSKAIAAAFRENVMLNKDSEQLSENMIDNIITLWNRALSNPAVMTVVLDCEARLGHNTPFDSIYKMTVIVQKASQGPAIRWSFQAIADLSRAGVLRGGVTAAMLGVGGHGGSNIGLVTLQVFKMNLRDHLLNHQLELLDVSVTFKTTVRKYFASHAAYREACGYPDPKFADSPEADLSWQSEYNKAESLLWSLWEALVFGVEYDSCLKQAIRLRKPVQEVLEYGVVGEAMTDVTTEIEKIKEAATQSAVVDSAATQDDEGQAGHGDGHEVMMVTKVIPDDLESVKAKWMKFAGVTVRQHVKLVVEPKSASGLPSLLADTKVMSVCPEKGFYNLFVYDTKTAGENKYRPHLRMPPLRDDHMQKLLGGVVAMRLDTHDNRMLRQTDLFAVLDGGRDMPDKMVNMCFVDGGGKAVMKSKRTIHISYLEDALTDSRSLHRGFTALNQIERMHLLTGHTLTLKERKRMIFQGTNSGNFIGPLAAPEKGRRLQLDPLQKREMYGPLNRISEKRGGHDDPDMDVECDIAEADETVVQNAFFHSMHVSFWKEVLHSYCVKSVVHLSGVDGSLACACIEMKAGSN